jgi:acyl-CoA synthetase (NDP forming)/GNAT superfamily N-acetyltransferase
VVSADRGEAGPFTAAAAGYPPHWEADVVLADGGTVHLRPITPADGDRLVAFHATLSPQTIYYRFFAAYPVLSDSDVFRFTTVDYKNRCGLVAVLGGEFIAVVRYDRVPDTEDAEVAFVVADAHQGRGISSVMLEHIAAVARENGICRFIAEVLPQNRKMVGVFRDAGYQTTSSFGDGSVHLEFPIEPTERSLDVMRAREHRAEARSIERLLFPRSVAVIGASRERQGVGTTVFRNLLKSGFEGPVYPVNPHSNHVAGVRAYSRISDIPDEVDLAVIATPADTVPRLVEECAGKSVRGLVIISSGFSEMGKSGRAVERELVSTALANGMRVIGPNCLGVINTDPTVSMNATLAEIAPGRGRIGFFSQSGALGIDILESVAVRGLGLSTFVSAGNRADVSGNDLLQYWEEDPVTDVILLYLESFGNPRKFARLARRVARSKPIVAVKSGRNTAQIPMGHTGVAVPISEEAADAVFRQAGVIRVETLARLFDVAQMLGCQPLPAGRRVAIVGNSTALGVLAADACVGAGLQVADLATETAAALRAALPPIALVGNPLALTASGSAADFRAALTAVLADPGVDAVITVFIPLLTTSDEEVARVLADVVGDATKPVASTFLAMVGLPEQMRRYAKARGARCVPSFRSPEAAVYALAKATEYAEWRARPVGAEPELTGIDVDRAREIVAAELAAAPAGRWLTPERTAELLACYGVFVWPLQVVANADEAAATAEKTGYPAALKASAEHLRHRPDLGTVRLGLETESELRAAYATMADFLGGGDAGLAVQAMAPPGVAAVVGVTEDPSFGALLSFGLAGVATDLLGDRAFRILPLTDLDVADLVRSIRAAPLLFGYRGSEPVDTAALHDVLLRVGRLADQVPEVVEVIIDPVIVSPQGVAVLSGGARVAPPAHTDDLGPRRLG